MTGREPPPPPPPPKPPEPPPAPADAEPPYVCHACGSINGYVTVHLAAWGITQRIPGCRYCVPHRPRHTGS